MSLVVAATALEQLEELFAEARGIGLDGSIPLGFRPWLLSSSAEVKLITYAGMLEVVAWSREALVARLAGGRWHDLATNCSTWNGADSYDACGCRCTLGDEA